MSKKIIFKAKDQYGWEVQPKPKPATECIPEWWKNMTPYIKSAENPDGNKLIINNRNTNAGPKKCVPMLDAINTGYIVSLFSDVQIKQVNGFANITWKLKSGDVFAMQGPGGNDVQPPTGYTRDVVKYLNTWIPITPPGYSILITTPLGHRDLPFYAIPAVIDSDKSQFELTVPMWVKSGFEGIVEKGTPLFQIIPFKRDAWESEFISYEDGQYDKYYDKKLGSTIINHYIKISWSKKQYK